MARRLKHTDLLFVSKSQEQRIKDFKAGASLVSRTGYALDEIIARATKDRLILAQGLLQSAGKMVRVRPPEYRLAVSRSYYAMYHAFRAAVFYMTEGDDYEKHVILPENIPKDFPNRNNWQNELKQARLERNRADYDPYPVGNTHFEASANHFITVTTSLMPTIRRYLRSKGCAL